MTEPLPTILEKSLQIAWDFLGGVGEIVDPQQAAEFLLRNLQAQALRGEDRPLMLANKAIDAYRSQPIKLVA